jgi:hypothetical protein
MLKEPIFLKKKYFSHNSQLKIHNLGDLDESIKKTLGSERLRMRRIVPQL